MAGPWEQYQADKGPWDQYASAPQEPYSGSILPLSKDETGKVRLDLNAGLPGALKRAVTLPGDVYSGKVDPMSDEGIGRALEMGAFFSPVNPAVRAGERAIAGTGRAVRPARTKPPTAQALKNAGGAGFDAVRGMDVRYRSDAVAALARKVQQELYQDGLYEKAAPDTWRILNELANPPENSVATLSGLEIARRQLRTAGKSITNPGEKAAAGRVRSRLDEFVEVADPATVVAGPARAAARANKIARENYAAGKRSEKLNNLEQSAELRAASTYSGQNLENTLRAKARDIVDPTKPRNREGFSPAELALIEKVARGTKTRSVLRYVGNLLGGGGGLGAGTAAAVAGGATSSLLGPLVGIPVGMATPALGFGAKRLATHLTQKAFRRADEAVRARSPLARQQQQMTPISPEGRAAMGRAAVAEALNGGPVSPAPPPPSDIVQELMRTKRPWTADEYEAFTRGGGL